MQCLYATSKDAASVQEKSTNWFVNGEMPVAYCHHKWPSQSALSRLLHSDPR